ncbi:OmpA/MotB protein [Candidatus Sulfotelmatomonas gaucii]|uniref:OmpA/MotB protein n=1 Tax=Candidatus Sulfuritelmatomonas gaucii TaxID=2043161 RepID=A0A2N9L3T9_9BACT|nr:OmpA/MotB protein [Candidatus Sulfotelmatomonas gaucii]
MVPHSNSKPGNFGGDGLMPAVRPERIRMKLTVRILIVMISVAVLSAVAQAQEDAAGSQDPAGMNRMANYYIADYQELTFDSYAFPVTSNGNKEEKTVEGKRIDIRYNLKDNVATPSPLQVVRNYESAVKAAGGQVMYDNAEDDEATLRLVRGGNETWVNLRVGNLPSGVPVMMTIIVKQAMTQEVVMDAAAMASSLSETGEVAIYGIHFDTGKSELKPESDAAIGEIAKLLKSQPDLKVFIVGHTDMVGDAASNVKLSQARAQSVIGALVTKYGIAAARLMPFGAGPYAPVATNRTDEGRGKNRRVELVEIATK